MMAPGTRIEVIEQLFQSLQRLVKKALIIGDVDIDYS